jgi:hypothetical protein
VSEEHPIDATAFLKLRLTDESLGAISDEIETAILDGIRRALAKIEFAADNPVPPK